VLTHRRFPIQFNARQKNDLSAEFPDLQPPQSTFTMDGDKIKIDKVPGGKASVLTLNSDGSISAPEGVKLVKK